MRPLGGVIGDPGVHSASVTGICHSDRGDTCTVNGPNRTSAGVAGHGEDFKARVLAATDIVELIGQSVALKRRGKDYVGLCPFHQEKTPSFKVDPGRQYFYCFGC